MTHVTGPRKGMVDALVKKLWPVIEGSRCTISECGDALGHVQELLLKAALRPLEQFNCPTCPKPENLTVKQIRKIEAAIKAAMEG